MPWASQTNSSVARSRRSPRKRGWCCLVLETDRVPPQNSCVPDSDLRVLTTLATSTGKVGGLNMLSCCRVPEYVGGLNMSARPPGKVECLIMTRSLHVARPNARQLASGREVLATDVALDDATVTGPGRVAERRPRSHTACKQAVPHPSQAAAAPRRVWHGLLVSRDRGAGAWRGGLGPFRCSASISSTL